MNPTSRRCAKPVFVLLTTLGLASTLGAQTASRATPPAAATEPEELVVLSPFEVNDTSDVGYLAQNTLAGSRLNTSLKDTAAAISVLTPEFLSDLAATNFSDVILYTNNSVPEYGDSAPNFNANPMIGNQENLLRIRGLPTSFARNYFQWEVSTDFFNVDRIDQARGPNAILFGFGSAGGIMNTTTKQAKLTANRNEFTFTAGSWNRIRGALDVNRVLVPDKFAIRVNAMVEKADSWREFEYNDERRLHLAARYQISRRSVLKAEAEIGTIDDLVTRPWLMVDQTYTWRAAGSPTYDGANWSSAVVTQQWQPHVVWTENDGSLLNWVNQPYSWPNSNNNWVHMAMTPENLALIPVKTNAGGPDADRTTDYSAWTLNYEHQVSDAFSFELAYNHQSSDFFGHDPEWYSYQLMGDASNYLPTGAANPHAGDFYIENYWGRRTRNTDSDFARAMASYQVDAGKFGRYRMAAMYERAWRDYLFLEEINVWANAPYAWSAEDVPNRIWRRYYFTPGNTADIRPPSWRNEIRNATVGGVALNSTWVPGQEIVDTSRTQDTLLAGAQAFYFEDRLALTLGYRHDKLDVSEIPSQRNATTHAWELNRATTRGADFSADTYTFGTVFDLTKQVSIFGNHSTSRNIPNIQQRVIGMPFAPVSESDGDDLGLKLDLFEGRFYATVAYYTTNVRNQAEWGDIGSAVRDRNLHILDALRSASRVTQAEYDARIINANSYLEDRESDGWEFELVANPTRRWRITANYSINNLVKTNIMNEVGAWSATNVAFWRSKAPDTFNLGWGDWDTLGANIGWMNDYLNSQVAFSGKQARGERKYNASVYTRYELGEGPLKGFAIGGGVRYRSPNAISIVNNQLYEGRSLTLVDLSLAYPLKTRLFGRERWIDLQLNVSNLFDRDDYQIYTVTWHNPALIERIGLQEPRKLTFTARFEF